MNLFLIIIVLLYGLVIGSFLNVVIYRLPRGENLAFPASHCPNCDTKLKPLDLVPVFSYLFMRARCRYCKQKISLIYPLIESINALLYLAVYYVYGISLISAIFMLASSVLLVIFMIDLYHFKILNSLNLFLFLLGLVLVYLQYNSLQAAILGACASGGILGVFILVANLFHKNSFGMGDVKYLFVAGFFLSFPYALTALFITTVIAAFSLVLLILFKMVDRNSSIPFAPFLTLGTLLTILLPELTTYLFI